MVDEIFFRFVNRCFHQSYFPIVSVTTHALDVLPSVYVVTVSIGVRCSNFIVFMLLLNYGDATFLSWMVAGLPAFFHGRLVGDWRAELTQVESA